MTHQDRQGRSKLVESGSLPMTAAGCIDLVVTNLGALKVDPCKGEFVLVECAPGVTSEEVLSATDAPIRVELQ